MATQRDFLRRLDDFGKNYPIGAPFFVEFPIKNVDKSCCTQATTAVIDFDETKARITALHQIKVTPKSCDALKISVSEERIDFIEMKGWSDFIKWQLKGNINKAKEIKEKVQKFNFGKKILDSLLIVLNNVVYTSDFKLTSLEEKVYFEIPKNYIILVDINLETDPLKILAITLGALATTSDIHTQIQVEIKNNFKQINNISAINLQKPILMSCQDIDTFYAI